MAHRKCSINISSYLFYHPSTMLTVAARQSWDSNDTGRKRFLPSVEGSQEAHCFLRSVSPVISQYNAVQCYTTQCNT